MLCSCRTSSLRLFVNSLAQLHISEASAATRAIPRLARTFRPTQATTSAFSTTTRYRHDLSTAAQGEEDASNGEFEAKETSTNKPSRFDDTTNAASSPYKKARGMFPRRTSFTASSAYSNSPPPAPRESWQSQKSALKEKFPEGWRPMKRLSPDAVAGIRALHAQFPDTYNTPALARQFEVSPEAIRRILKSKWTPNADEEEHRQERWFRRGKSVWSRYAELGMKPPQKWRREGVTRDPTWHEKRQAAISRRQEEETRGSGGALHRKLGAAIM